MFLEILKPTNKNALVTILVALLFIPITLNYSQSSFTFFFNSLCIVINPFNCSQTISTIIGVVYCLVITYPLASALVFVHEIDDNEDYSTGEKINFTLFLLLFNPLVILFGTLALFNSPFFDSFWECGLEIDGVESIGPASISGVKKGDVIVAIDGNPVKSLDGLRNYMRLKAAGDFVVLQTFSRNITFNLGKKPGQQNAGWLGLNVSSEKKCKKKEKLSRIP